jgi:hypothetical protein
MDYLDLEKLILILFFIITLMAGIGVAILCILFLESNTGVNAMNSSLILNESLRIENSYVNYVAFILSLPSNTTIHG